MIERNLLHVFWMFYTFAVTFSGVALLFAEKKLPKFLVRIFKFGKTNKHLSGRKSFVSIFEVPKSWFRHFYIFAFIYFFTILLEVFGRYVFGNYSPVFDDLLDIFTTKHRKSTIPAESVVVLSFLLFLQVARRCYECHIISVYSDAKMNIIHYIVGLTFYFGVGLSLLSEAPGFNSNRNEDAPIPLNVNWLTFKHLVGILMFLFGFLMQYQAHIGLASLRKDKDGKKVVTMKHAVPNGGWFEYLSCPHYCAEIIIYLSAALIMDGRNITWWLLCQWVVTNQTITGLINHQWYKQTFKNYPPERKAIIPFLL